jgi:hypothetical protein
MAFELGLLSSAPLKREVAALKHVTQVSRQMNVEARVRERHLGTDHQAL